MVSSAHARLRVCAAKKRLILGGLAVFQGTVRRCCDISAASDLLHPSTAVDPSALA
jgi:hypothetical protein